MAEGNGNLPAVSTRPATLGMVQIDRAQEGTEGGGIRTDGNAEGVIDLAVPNLLPTDNASEIYEIPIHRLKVPIRISQLTIRVVDNGYLVELPHAGRQGMFGPDGSHHVFSGPDAKAKMLEFVALVIGQVTYQYREVEGDDYHRIKRRMEGGRASNGPEEAGPTEPAKHYLDEEIRL